LILAEGFAWCEKIAMKIFPGIPIVADLKTMDGDTLKLK